MGILQKMRYRIWTQLSSNTLRHSDVAFERWAALVITVFIMPRLQQAMSRNEMGSSHVTVRTGYYWCNHSYTYPPQQTTTSMGILPSCSFAVSLSYYAMNRCKYYHLVGIKPRRSARGAPVLHINISLLVDVAAAIIQTKSFWLEPIPYIFTDLYILFVGS